MRRRARTVAPRHIAQGIFRRPASPRTGSGNCPVAAVGIETIRSSDHRPVAGFNHIAYFHVMDVEECSDVLEPIDLACWNGVFILR